MKTIEKGLKMKTLQDYDKATDDEQIAFWDDHLDDHLEAEQVEATQGRFSSAIYEQEIDGETTGLWALCYNDDSGNGNEYVFDFENEELAIDFVNQMVKNIFLNDEDE